MKHVLCQRLDSGYLLLASCLNRTLAGLVEVVFAEIGPDSGLGSVAIGQVFLVFLVIVLIVVILVRLATLALLAWHPLALLVQLEAVVNWMVRVRSALWNIRVIENATF